MIAPKRRSHYGFSPERRCFNARCCSASAFVRPEGWAGALHLWCGGPAGWCDWFPPAELAMHVAMVEELVRVRAGHVGVACVTCVRRREFYLCGGSSRALALTLAQTGCCCFAHFGIFGRFGPVSADVGPTSTNMCENLTKIGTDVGPALAAFDEHVKQLDQVCAACVQMRPMSANSEQISTTYGLKPGKYVRHSTAFWPDLATLES